MAAIIVFGLVSLYLLTVNSIFGLMFLVFIVSIAFIQYKFFDLSINYIKHHIENDIDSILHFIEQKG